jgi:hypothetical protein
MATVPSAGVTVDPTAAAPGGGDDLVCVLAPCVSLADRKPRQYGSAAAIILNHGYCEGVEYAAMHFAGTGLPLLFVGMPIGTAGAVSRSTGFTNTGTSVVTAVAGVNGVLAEHDGVVKVVAGGTIGTSQIKLDLSLDGGRSFQPVRLGTAVSYAIPNVGVTLNFAAGTLVTGDTALQWYGSGPLVNTADLAQVRANLAADQRIFRTLLVIGDAQNLAGASALVTQLNAYATENDRHILGRWSVRDRLAQASMSIPQGRMTGTPTLTFAEVGGTGDTVTRNSGSWLADGYVVGDTVTFTGTALNNVSGPVAGVTDAVLTFGTTDLAAEVIAVQPGGVASTSYPTITFAEVGATGDTITRSRGSWLVDGFRVGDTFTVTGSASNNVSSDALTGVTASTLTLNTTDLAAEVISAAGLTIVSNQTKSAWMAARDAEFATLDAQPRIDLSAGRSNEPSPFSGWERRVPAAWLASVREYQHDLHIPTWRKDLGPVGVGGGLFNSSGDLVEWDDRVDGGAGSAARFTTLRTWANGPRGTFVTLSLTRAGDGQIASLTHNQVVINAAANTVQIATENVIGRTLQLNSDGTATKESLGVIASEVNNALRLVLLADRGEGPRVSSAVWSADPSVVFNVPEPIMLGVLRLLLNGTVHSVETRVRVQANG